MHAPCMLAADSVGESLRAAASSQTACCVPVHAVGCMQWGACQVHAVLDGGFYNPSIVQVDPTPPGHPAEAREFYLE
eukprot:SAG25_NODE_23_length_22180_cov_132.152892_13_plen_77_part_00